MADHNERSGGVRSVEQTLGHLRAIDTGTDAGPAGQVAPMTLEDLYRTHRMRLVRLAVDLTVPFEMPAASAISASVRLP